MFPWLVGGVSIISSVNEPLRSFRADVLKYEFGALFIIDRYCELKGTSMFVSLEPKCSFAGLNGFTIANASTITIIRSAMVLHL